MIKSRTKFKPMTSIFRYSSDDERQMQVQLARVCVLYEDLQIELAGMLPETLPDLDRTDAITRRFYFVRRTLGTLTEIEGAINKLQMNADFKNAKQWWSEQNLKTWNEAVAFFSAGHAFLKEWRNDLGGHFHDTAATFAIEHLNAATIASMEFYRRGNGADVKMPFAYNLVAVAMTKNNKSSQPELDYVRDAFQFIVDASKHAVHAVQVLVSQMIVTRF